MSEFFSTLESVTVKADSLRIQTGVIDFGLLDSALEDSKSEILAYVQPRYGSTITDAWTSSTRPALIGSISDWLTLYRLLTGNNAEHPVAIRMYEQSLQKLQKIADYTIMIPGVEFTTGQTNTTTRMAYLECSEENADNGLCDPCSYQYT